METVGFHFSLCRWASNFFFFWLNRKSDAIDVINYRHVDFFKIIYKVYVSG